jgi:hypothetical protein
VTLVDAFATVLAIAGSVAAFACALLALVSAAALVATGFVVGALLLAVWGGARLVALADGQAG